MDKLTRTPVREKAKQIAPLLRTEHPDYNYLREVFRHLRKEFELTIPKPAITKRQVSSTKEIAIFLKCLNNDSNTQNKLMVRTLLYTGVRVSELVNIQIVDINC